MMFYRSVCYIFWLIFFAFLVGCGSVDRGKHSCAILLESYGETCPCSVILPVSSLHVNVAPTPLFDEKDIRNITVRECIHGHLLIVTLTDHAAYEMHRLVADAYGRKILFEYNGMLIGFSILDDAIDSHELIFVPEISSEACCNLFCSER
ncbi:MAG: hypothetical protein LBB15_00015 [Puniceicoccales bacterium]|jgi:hypothetical protein|nr:hypothetical protein [Puniceicoccales bacterium]